MARSSSTITFAHTTDAQYRAWVKAIKVGLAAVGATQTADTGQVSDAQIDPATGTLVRPGVSSTTHYLMYQVGPVVWKLSFGTAGSTTSPRIVSQVAAGSNGSGTLTGNTGTSYTMSPTADTTARAARFASQDGGLAMALATDTLAAAGTRLTFAVEPWRDGATGTPSTEGVFHLAGTEASSNVFNESLAVSGTASGGSSTLLQIAHGGSFTLANGNIALVPLFPIYNGLRNPSKLLAAYVRSETGVDVQVTSPNYGSSGTWLTTNACFVQNSTTWGLALRWEA